MEAINIFDLLDENSINDFLNELSIEEIELLIKELYLNDKIWWSYFIY